MEPVILLTEAKGPMKCPNLNALSWAGILLRKLLLVLPISGGSHFDGHSFMFSALKGSSRLMVAFSFRGLGVGGPVCAWCG